MIDPSRLRVEYEQRLAAFKKADSLAIGLARTVSRAGQMLANVNWQFAIVSGYDFPTGVGTGGATCIGGEAWPTMQQLGEAFSRWHWTKLAAQQGYSHVPADHRDGLELPPR